VLTTQSPVAANVGTNLATKPFDTEGTHRKCNKYYIPNLESNRRPLAGKMNLSAQVKAVISAEASRNDWKPLLDRALDLRGN
jgi:hypothetical protein